MNSSFLTRSMEYIKTKVRELIPSYAIVPLMTMLLVNVAAYYGTRIYSNDEFHYNIATPLDLALPFLPIFVLPYVLAYVQWIVGYIVIARESKEHCYYILIAEIIAKVLVGITFLVFPTTLNRPHIVSTDFFSVLTALIYRADPANNLFPSIHCLESMFVLYGTMTMSKASSAYKRVMGTMTVFVILSTVLIKQHVIWDALGAFVYMGVGLIVAAHLVKEK